ncbi:PotD/PotF family extracellular solute-binding protein [Candidatus Dependentiae bacterium]
MNNKTRKNNFVLNKIIVFIFFVILGMFLLYVPKFSEFMFDNSKVLCVYTYADFISPEIVKDFEKKEGVRVRLKYFDNDNELLAKFKIDKGSGYDVITATDFAIDLLIKDNMLQPIDIKLVQNVSDLNKSLMNKFFDPQNKYSLPYLWSVYGIIYKKDLINESKNQISWKLIFQNPSKQFNKKISSKICMLDTPLESVFLGAIYMFGSTKNLSNEKFKQIQELLMHQKKWVDVYMSGSLQYYLLSEVVNIAVTYTSFAKKIMEISDEYDFVIPKEGSILSIDSVAIPKGSQKKELAHKFINFLLSKKTSVLAYNEYGYNPANKKAYIEIESKFIKNKNLFPHKDMFDKLHIIHNNIPSKIIENIWLMVRLN